MGVQSREPEEGDTVTITESDGYIVARDEATGVASQGKSKIEALENLAEALELHERPDPEGTELEEATAPWLSDE